MSTTTPYLPPYAPREGTKQAEACNAIAQAGGLSCEPLSRILGCTLHQVPAFLKTPLERGYLAKERREGVLHLVMGPKADTAKPEKINIAPAPAPVMEARPDVDRILSGVDRWCTSDSIRLEPEVKLSAMSVAAMDETIEAPLGDFKPTKPTPDADWHAYEKGEVLRKRDPATWGEAIVNGVCMTFAELGAQLTDAKNQPKTATTKAAPRDLGCAISSDREFRILIGDEILELTRDEAGFLHKALHGFHLGGLL